MQGKLPKVGNSACTSIPAELRDSMGSFYTRAFTVGYGFFLLFPAHLGTAVGITGPGQSYVDVMQRKKKRCGDETNINRDGVAGRPKREM